MKDKAFGYALELSGGSLWRPWSHDGSPGGSPNL